MQNDHRRTVIFETQQWLFEKFPACFKKDFSLPLKVGILKDIFEGLSEEDGMSRLRIRKAIQAYTNHPWYQRALTAKKDRVDLEGKTVEPVEEEHKVAAEKNLAYRKLRTFANQQQR